MSLSETSLIQTPPTLTIKDVKEINALPNGFISTSESETAMRCSGGVHKSLVIKNTKINTIENNAITNVFGVRIEFDNVDIDVIESDAISIRMASESEFILNNSRVDLIEANGVTVAANRTIINDNIIVTLNQHSFNLTSDETEMERNLFMEIKEYAFVIESTSIDIKDNVISNLRRDALSAIKCRNNSSNGYINFTNNKIHRMEPYSLLFDYNSCKNVNAVIAFTNNKLNCNCQHAAYLLANEVGEKTELKAMILDNKNNNTCLSAPCYLPLEIIKTLVDGDMCRLNLNDQIKCLLYNDNNTIINSPYSDEETSTTLSFYIIRQANEVSDNLSTTDLDNIIKDGKINITNRTIVKVAFDPVRGFIESLRNTNVSSKTEPENNDTEMYEPANNRGRVEDQHKYNFEKDREKASNFYKTRS